MVGQKTQAPTPTPSQPTTPTQPSTPSTPSTPSQPSTPAQNAPVKPLEKTPQKPSKVTTTQPQVKNLSNTGSNVTILAIVAVIALVAGSRASSHELNTIRSSSVVGVCPRTQAHPHTVSTVRNPVRRSWASQITVPKNEDESQRRPIIRRYARHRHLAYSDGTEFRLRGQDACIRGGDPMNRSSFHIQLNIRRSQQIPFSRIMQNGERR